MSTLRRSVNFTSLVIHYTRTAHSHKTNQPEMYPQIRPLSVKHSRTNENAPHSKLQPTHKKWLDQDVRYIIRDEERSAFMKLPNDEERDQFIEQFWLR